jgi:hypothetical protein
MIFLAVVMPI